MLFLIAELFSRLGPHPGEGRPWLFDKLARPQLSRELGGEQDFLLAIIPNLTSDRSHAITSTIEGELVCLARSPSTN